MSVGRTLTDHPLADLLTGGRPQFGESVSTQWRRRLPADVITRGTTGHALAFDERNQPAWIPLAPSHAAEPWRSLRSLGHQLDLPSGRETRRPPHRTDLGAER